MHAFLLYFGGEKKKKIWGKEKKDLRKLISHCICKAFWDTRTPGGSCLRTINNFSEFVLGFSLREQEIDMEVCLPKMGAANKKDGEMDER